MQFNQEDFTVRVGASVLQVRRLIAAGNAASPTLVFLHDALGSILQWKGFPEHVVTRTGLNAVLFDRQGHGRSAPFSTPRMPDYLHREALEVLPSILDQLELQDPILIGHSDGGSIALIHGASFRARAIVTLAAHVFVEQITLDGIRKALKDHSRILSRLRKYHGEKAGALFEAWSGTWLSGEFRNWDIRPELSGIECPVLVVQGDSDEYGTLEQVHSIVRGVKGPAREEVIPGVGHLPFLEQPESLAMLISRFLNTSRDGGEP